MAIYHTLTFGGSTGIVAGLGWCWFWIGSGFVDFRYFLDGFVAIGWIWCLGFVVEVCWSDHCRFCFRNPVARLSGAV